MDSRFPELDALYRDVILDHFRAPRGRTPVLSPDVENHGLNPVCGDEVKVALKLLDGKISEAGIYCRGCAISVASGSMLSELLRGKTPAEFTRLAAAFKDMMHGRGMPKELDIGDLDALEGVKQLPVRVKCAMLPWTTIEDALAMREKSGAHTPANPTTTEDPES